MCQQLVIFDHVRLVRVDAHAAAQRTLQPQDHFRHLLPAALHGTVLQLHFNIRKLPCGFIREADNVISARRVQCYGAGFVCLQVFDGAPVRQHVHGFVCQPRSRDRGARRYIVAPACAVHHDVVIRIIDVRIFRQPFQVVFAVTFHDKIHVVIVRRGHCLHSLVLSVRHHPGPREHLLLVDVCKAGYRPVAQYKKYHVVRLLPVCGINDRYVLGDMFCQDIQVHAIVGIDGIVVLQVPDRLSVALHVDHLPAYHFRRYVRAAAARLYLRRYVLRRHDFAAAHDPLVALGHNQ